MNIYKYILLIIFISCNTTRNEDTYKVINKIGNHIILRAKLLNTKEPKPPKGKKKEFEIKNELDNKKNITVLVYPHFIKVKKYNISDKKLLGYKDLFQKLINNEDFKKINIAKLKFLNSKVSLYNKKNTNRYERDFYLFSFSNVVLNNDKTKAVVMASFGTSSLDTATILFFLKKENNDWIIIYEKLVSIS